MEDRLEPACAACEGSADRVAWSARPFTWARELAVLGAAALAFGLGLLIRPSLPFFAAAYLIVGAPVLVKAARAIAKGRVFNELFLMSIASLGAMAIGHYEEAVAVMAFFRLGEALQEAAGEKSRDSVRALLALRPGLVRLSRDGNWVLEDPAVASAGEIFLVMAGERAALDGEILEGEGFVDASTLTGESLPVSLGPGSELLAGNLSLDASFTARALRPAAQSAAARIAGLVEEAARSKAKGERMVSRIAAVYTPIVVAAAALVAFVPPLAVAGQSLSAWGYRALVLLVVSCPCALVLSVPLAYFCGMGGMARRGILVKGACVLDSLARARAVVFDKTGTLTAGNFRLAAIESEPGFGNVEVLALAAAAESRSRHPVAAAIREAAAERGLSPGVEDEASEVRELPGAGVAATVGARRIAAGNDRLLHLEGVPHFSCSSEGTVVNVAVDGALAGRLLVADEPRPDAKTSLARLKRLGAARIVMLTGDSEAAAERLARRVGIDEWAAGLLPEGKLERLEAVVRETAAADGTTVFVGDGVNDSPALARADVGVAMGSGSDVAVEGADLVLMSGELSRLPEAIERARHSRRVALECALIAMGVKAVFLALGAAGIAGMWEAVAADSGVALLAVANALRARSVRAPV